MIHVPPPARALLLALATVLSGGCQGMYYGTMEKFGYHKRDLLVERVEEARDSQEDAKEQYTTALEQFTAVVKFSGGDLEAMYRKLDREFDRCQSKASAVSTRIDSVEKVAEALFQEWEQELEQYKSVDLRAVSERRLLQTRQRYQQLRGAMRRAEARMKPVLVAFGDQVLFLKHNLNARAILSLQDELTSVETDIAALIKEMEISIEEADVFIQTMGDEKEG